jgi:uncharacterized glyoxalase superfamily protein PhnB
MPNTVREGHHTVTPALIVRNGAEAVEFYRSVYVVDVDAAIERAVAAGAKVLMPVTDMFHGDRLGLVEDPSGHRWGLVPSVEDVPPADLPRRRGAFFASMDKK